MTDLLTLPAPAKLNLFLHITGRRADGYHTLQTLFQLLDRGDWLTFRRRRDNAINLTPQLPGVDNQDNLIVRAARALQQHTGTNLGADIELDKRLPMGGGIGGGSSNAATTLLGLNQLWNLQLGVTTLAALGQRLGADVPVFVEGRTAWAEGIGERLQAVDMPEKWFLVATPDCQVSTADIFSHKDLTRNTSDITVAAFLEQGGHNDCQPLVQKLYPQVAAALEWLNQYAPARMTGTGASVFASFDDRASAEAALEQIPDSLQGFVAQAVNQSPTLSLLNR